MEADMRIQMTCDQAIELLPWLLNGTLEAGEREAVRGHLVSCSRCREALAETRQAFDAFDQHLPSRTLVALAHGEPPADAALAERHLASCPQCSAELELARMSRRLEEDDKIALFPGQPVREIGREPRAWRAATLAAGIAGLVAMGGWLQSATTNERIQQERTQLEAQVAQMATAQKPQLNSWTESVYLDDVERGGPASAEITIPADVASTPMLEARGEGTSREIELLDAGGRVVWGAPGLRRTSNDDYALTFPPHFLKPGLYTIQLYSRENGERSPREKYKIRIR